jgi:transposase-like protein
LPSTLVEAIRYFDDTDLCIQYVAQLRWAEGPICPTCQGTEHSYLTTRRVWKCKSCKRQFSVKQGTIFEDSPIKLKNWLAAIWLIANSKNGISSYELGKAIGVCQKTAWFMLHRIRLAMRTGSFERFSGETEVDETFVGGKLGNKHKWRRAEFQKARKSLTHGKTIVVGAKNRETGKVTAKVVNERGVDTLVGFIGDTVDPTDSHVFTDAWKPYRGLRHVGIPHSWVDHGGEKYVEGRVHTNGIENFWALLKRGIHGTYVQIDPRHLMRYVDERVFTYNLRTLTDYERFQMVLRHVSGRRLTYAELTA